MADIPFHPLANIFPLLEGVQFRDLVEDIRVHGLQEPIILFEGSILDGRNRARACMAAQVSARYKTYDGRDPVAFVVSANLHRRHLDVSQRAMIAASISEKKSGVKRGASKKVGGKIAKYPRPERYKPPSAQSGKVSHQQAAALLGVSPGSVSQAHRVTKAGIPELVAAVNDGDVSVSAAATVASFPKDQQRAILDSGSKSVTVIAREEMNSRRGIRYPKHHRPAVVSSYETFRLGDGRAIGHVRFGELAQLEQAMLVVASVIRRVRQRVANADHSAKVSAIIAASKLSEIIEQARQDVKAKSSASA